MRVCRVAVYAGSLLLVSVHYIRDNYYVVTHIALNSIPLYAVTDIVKSSASDCCGNDTVVGERNADITGSKRSFSRLVAVVCLLVPIT